MQSNSLYNTSLLYFHELEFQNGFWESILAPDQWSMSEYCQMVDFSQDSHLRWSVRVDERLALPTSDHGVAGSNPAGDEILPEPKQCFIAQSLSCSPFHRLKMTEILLKGHKTLTHASIHLRWLAIHMHTFFNTFARLNGNTFVK